MATTKITSPDLFDLGSLNTALQLPNGTTAERPTSPSTGEWRYNTTTNLIEFYDGANWRDLQSEDIPPIPSEHFNTVLYDGNGSTNNITGVGFQPDLVWIKQRDTAVENHNWYDSTRGVRNFIVSNSTAANVLGSVNRLNAFGADGFTVGSDNEINDSGSKYVAWCWKANGGTTSSNSEGNVTSTVQANTKGGFSIVKWTGDANNTTTVGHGLNSAPELIISKNLDTAAADGWPVFTTSIGNDHTLFLNTTAVKTSTGGTWGSTSPTSTVFTVQDNAANNQSGNEIIAYCFHSVAGYSKIGSYTGNASDSGPIINTGFEPAWLMIKISDGSGDGWFIVDNKRDTSNPRDIRLFANSTAVEASESGAQVDFFTNGFQIRGTGSGQGQVNASGSTYLYLAFAATSSTPTLADSFTIATYSGNGGTQSISGLGFSPNWVWAKKRSGSDDNVWFDTIRGVQKELVSNSTAAQATKSAAISSFDSDGFTTGNNGALNGSSSTYVGWNWKANTAPTYNTDGTTPSIVSANQAAGFSIVRYTGNGNSAATVGHGLSAKCDLVIIKDLDSADKWIVQLPQLGDNARMVLEGTAAKTDDSTTAQAGNASYFGIGGDNSVNKSSDEYIAYCFHSVSGYSSIGSYTGVSSGVTITTGFRPSFMLIKSTSNVENWAILDTTRGNQKCLNPNLSNAESDSALNTFTVSDTGFSFPDQSIADAMLNENGYEYLYWAIKENPSTTVVPAGEMSYLVAAGGASGGAFYGGGGGAGGLRTSYGSSSGGGASAESNITLSTGTYTITIGGGGSAVTSSTYNQGNNGSASSISGTASVSTVGGGGGGTYVTNTSQLPGLSGGSGGGGGALGQTSPYVSPKGTGTANEGFDGADGGLGSFNGTVGPGGGGGAGTLGVASSGGYRVGGNGGAGLAVNIVPGGVFAGGGAGGGEGGAGIGGIGGGGKGGVASSSSGGNGITNTGSGGGGCGNNGSSLTSGAGGSGVVILRMRTSDYSGSTTGSPLVRVYGDETILTFTGSGTYVHS